MKRLICVALFALVPATPTFAKKIGVLLRSDSLRPGTVLRQELTDFFSQDLIAGWTQVDLIADKQRLDRFAVVTKHVGADIDVFCFGLCLEEVVYQLIKFQDIFQESHAGRARFDGDKRNRYGRGISPENGK